jgi:hypothetical protein
VLLYFLRKVVIRLVKEACEGDRPNSATTSNIFPISVWFDGGDEAIIIPAVLLLRRVKVESAISTNAGAMHPYFLDFFC